MSLPAIGTRAVHKDDHAKSNGPVWEVYGHKEKEDEVRLKTARHKLNAEQEPTAKDVPAKEFNDNYVQL